MRRWAKILGLALLVVWFNRAAAQQIVLTTASIIGGSATQDGATFSTGQYTAGLVANQQTGAISAENNTSGPITYWLGPNGSTSAYFVVDLGAPYTLAQISLFNTHNAGYNDRATIAFRIQASNTINSLGAAGYDLVSATTILSSNLAFASPVTETIFTSGNGLTSGGTAYQYLRFTADSYYSTGPGLNEIRVFSAIPEPSTVATLTGAVVFALVLVRRRWRVA